MRLNGWQRIGIVLSVLWFLVGASLARLHKNSRLKLHREPSSGRRSWVTDLKLPIVCSLFSLFCWLSLAVGRPVNYGAQFSPVSRQKDRKSILGHSILPNFGRAERLLRIRLLTKFLRQLLIGLS